ncbi:hypothetical protein V4R08_04605 [Nitrobacter sp. NHB1]|uniref:hypothetical protein n=1 Tax=Nitrobacter sp. NHB1 TaxID=3119830 RepID=UPI002FFFE725
MTDGTLATRLSAALNSAGIPYGLTLQHQESDNDPFNPTVTWVDHDAQGWVDNYSQQDLTGTLIQANDRKVFIVCSSLDLTPATVDRLVISGITYTVVNVALDPASTCWVIQARK